MSSFKILALLITTASIISCSPKSRHYAPPTEVKPAGPVVEPPPVAPTPALIDPTICDRNKQEGGFQMPNVKLAVAANEIKIMAYNAENLFNTKHDTAHSDWTYLPKTSPYKVNCKNESSQYYIDQCYNTDWNDQIVDVKLEQLADVVRAQGATPDLIGLEEVEATDVVRRFAKKLGYKKVLATTGSDGRGINNAIIYKEDKLRFIESREAEVLQTGKETRNILGAYFRPRVKSAAKQIISFYVNHWPSQNNPSFDRILAAATLKKMIEYDRARFAKQGFVLNPVAVGDFNTIDSDKPHAFKEVILAKNWSGRLVSINEKFERLEFKAESEMCTLVQNMPKGTYYYKKAVQTLDYIFVGQNMLDGKDVEVDVESFRIVPGVNASELIEQNVIAADGTVSINKILIPLRLNEKATAPGPGVGATDHFPVVMRVKLN